MVPLGAVLHNPPGSIGGRQPANTTMRPHMVVEVAPEPQHRAGTAERHAQRLVEALVTTEAAETLDIAVLMRLARRDAAALNRSVLRHPIEPQGGQPGACYAPVQPRCDANSGRRPIGKRG